MASFVHPPQLCRIVRIVTAAAVRWHERQALRHGAAISFYSIFSLAPLLIIVTEAAALLFGSDAAQGRLFAELAKLIGPTSAKALEAIIASAHQQPRQGMIASLTAFVLTFVGASGVFVELEEAITAIFGGTPSRRSAFASLLWTRLHAFALVLGLCFLLLVSLIFSAALSALRDYIARDLLPAFAVGGELLNFALLAAAFALLIYYLPRPRPGWLSAWLGGVTAGLLFVAGKWAVGFYLGRSTVSSAYGAAGSLVVVMIWVYYTTQALLFGAALTQAANSGPTPGARTQGTIFTAGSVTSPGEKGSGNDATVPRSASG